MTKLRDKSSAALRLCVSSFFFYTVSDRARFMIQA